MTNFLIQTAKRCLIQFRLTEGEKNKLRYNAKETGMTMTDFIKLRTLGRQPKRRIASFDREILIRLSGELGKIGSNVNRIAAFMNANKSYGAKIRETVIEQTLTDIRTLSGRILDELTANDKQ